MTPATHALHSNLVLVQLHLISSRLWDDPVSVSINFRICLQIVHGCLQDRDIFAINCIVSDAHNGTPATHDSGTGMSKLRAVRSKACGTDRAVRQ